MTVNRCEVAVVGGGLSGCSAAISLARAGVDVALFEAGRLPRHRVCGEFLSPESRATLKRLGAAELMAQSGARSVQGARFCCGALHADFDLGNAPGLALSRFSLDPLLWQVAESAGVGGFLEAKVRDFHSENDEFHFEANGQSWSAQTVIYAAGRAAAPRPPSDKTPRFCGLKAHFADVDLESGVVEMHLFRGGYCGLVRVEGQATNACLMVDTRHFPKTSPDEFWAQLLTQIPALRARFERAMRVAPWSATAAVSFDQFRPTDSVNDDTGPNGVLYAGDAAGYIHPLTGDGMAMALRAGELAATVARLQVRGLNAAEAARLYDAAWRREFAPRLRLAARLHPLALRPHWAKPLTPLVQRLPALKAAWTRGTRGAL